MRRFLSGFRFGSGGALAVVRPANLSELWQVLTLCVSAGKIVIAQAANTGLTGGSTPQGDDYDRDIVVINMMRMNTLHVINDGKQVVCMPGSTLDNLEKTLKPLGREPHSLIGSSCLGASVIGGVCNNSGGSLVQRGPSYTELALFARLSSDGKLELINHLGIDLGDTPETILRALDQQAYTPTQIHNVAKQRASDQEYTAHVRQINEDTPARFNADPRRLFEASGSAGKVIVFAARLDTFEKPKNSKVFYVGTNTPSDLTQLRRNILTSNMALPIAGEYIHRDAFNIAERYGKDTYLLIKTIGTDNLPLLFATKARIDAIAERFGFLPADFSDRLLQFASRFFPSHLPARMRKYRDDFEHHLILNVDGAHAAEYDKFLRQTFAKRQGSFFECSTEEGAAAFLHRFAVAGAAVRYRAVHRKQVGEIVALDVALPRNTQEWIETLPTDLESRLEHKLYYGHFFCHVFHQDYVLKKGESWQEIEHEMLGLLDARGAKYPAEHNVGHLYIAPDALADHYKSLDPCNCFNPGIGHTTKREHWADMT